MIRISYEDMHKEFFRILLSRGFSEDNAKAAADVFAGNSLDGIYSHGVNRFPRAVDYLDRGEIKPEAQAECISGFGAMERWDGKRGFGPLNAARAMDRACELAEKYGIGLVALGNSNHWMRGGSYGWQAANKGFIGICWSNTMPNMPAWGGADRKIGNNPIVLAVPHSSGEHMVFDCALSQFSYGKLEEARLAGRQLPFPGGYDEKGELTTDPESIEKTWRVLPMGYWKGSGMSILLDLISTALTDANSVSKIGGMGDEVGLSQIMIAVSPDKLGDAKRVDRAVEELKADLRSSKPVVAGGLVLYPGERELKTRRENMELGIPVNEEVWNIIKSK